MFINDTRQRETLARLWRCSACLCGVVTIQEESASQGNEKMVVVKWNEGLKWNEGELINARMLTEW